MALLCWDASLANVVDCSVFSSTSFIVLLSTFNNYFCGFSGSSLFLNFARSFLLSLRNLRASLNHLYKRVFKAEIVPSLRLYTDAWLIAILKSRGEFEFLWFLVNQDKQKKWFCSNSTYLSFALLDSTLNFLYGLCDLLLAFLSRFCNFFLHSFRLRCLLILRSYNLSRDFFLLFFNRSRLDFSDCGFNFFRF